MRTKQTAYPSAHHKSDLRNIRRGHDCKECRDYDEMIAHLALRRIEPDLNDGVQVNYEKIQTANGGKKYAVLAKI